MDGEANSMDLPQRGQESPVWGALLALTTTAALYALDELSPGEVADAMALAVGIYMGAVALEEGLARSLTVWMRGPRPVGSSGPV